MNERVNLLRDELASRVDELTALAPTDEVSNLPKWRRGMVVGQWKPLPGTSLDDAKTEGWLAHGEKKWRYSLGAWIGMGYSRKRHIAVTLAPGGHDVHRMNMAVAIDLSRDDPRMYEATYTTPPDKLCTFTDEFGSVKQCRVNHDGRPPSQHSYYNNHYSDVLGLALSFGASALEPTGQYPMVMALDLDEGDYLPDGTIPDMPMSQASKADCPTTMDWSTGRVYRCIPNYSGWSIFDPHAYIAGQKPWTTRNTRNRVAHSCLAVDTRRGRMLCPQWPEKQGKMPFLLDMETWDEEDVVFGGLGQIVGGTDLTPGMFGQTDNRAWGMDFAEHPTDPAKDLYLLKQDLGIDGQNGRIFGINAETLDSFEIPTTGGEEIKSPFNLSGNKRPWRLYNKFHFDPEYGTVLYVPGGWEDPAWVLRIV